MVNNQVQVMADHQRLAVVDLETAQKSKNPPQGLAMIWVNQTRSLLGAETLDRNRDTANRGLIVPRPDAKLLKSLQGGKLDSNKKLVLQETGSIMKGLASWYGPGFNGHRSSDGSRFDMMAMTAAHRSLPFGTVVRVSNAKTGKACLVRITDRGPFTGDRIIDLSKGAASEIGMLGSGIAKVTLSVLKKSIIPSQDPSSSSNAFIGLSSLVR
ncbi:MAG: septal ring lytic transglycosylase RlpA family protein [Cyanobacteria bacterium]|nr:septal ring lytic transglycosylase RlpA family protein [Cyanobacteriota bacterium]